MSSKRLELLPSFKDVHFIFYNGTITHTYIQTTCNHLLQPVQENGFFLKKNVRRPLPFRIHKVMSKVSTSFLTNPPYSNTLFAPMTRQVHPSPLTTHHPSPSQYNLGQLPNKSLTGGKSCGWELSHEKVVKDPLCLINNLEALYNLIYKFPITLIVHKNSNHEMGQVSDTVCASFCD